MTWDDHLAWCKKRAIDVLDKGDFEEAVLLMAVYAVKTKVGSS